MDALAVRLELLERAELVHRLADEDLSYLFKHALTQETAYETLLLKKRRELNRLVAGCYERLYPERLDELAPRLTEYYSVAGDAEKTAQYASRAGDAALGLYAPTEARSFFARALDALSRLPDNDINAYRRMELLIKLVSVSAYAAPPTLNLERLDEASKIASRLSQANPAVSTYLAEIYLWNGFINQMRSDPHQALQWYEESRVLSKAIHDDQRLARSLFNAAIVLSFQGQFGKAEPLLVESIDLMRRIGRPLEGHSALGNLGLARAERGFYEQGLADALQGLGMAKETNQPGLIEASYTLLAQIYLTGRDAAALETTGRELLAVSQGAQDQVFVYWGNLILALADGLTGKGEPALEHLASARSIVDRFHGQVPRRGLGTAIEAETMLSVGRTAEAQALAEQAVGLARATEGIFAEGWAQRVWGLALARAEPPRYHEAEEHLGMSLRLFEEGEARIEAAWTQEAWGRVLEQRGDRQGARQHLKQGAARLAAFGLVTDYEERSRHLD